MTKPRKITGYMCSISWDHELGEDFYGTRIYPSLKALREDHGTDCAAVRVEVREAPKKKRKEKQ